MKTGKLIINSSQPYRNRKDETSYIPEDFLKTQEILAENCAEKKKLAHNFENSHF